MLLHSAAVLLVVVGNINAIDRLPGSPVSGPVMSLQEHLQEVLARQREIIEMEREIQNDNQLIADKLAQMTIDNDIDNDMYSEMLEASGLLDKIIVNDLEIQEENARLQALMVQQELALQSLAIANNAPKNVLSLLY